MSVLDPTTGLDNDLGWQTEFMLEVLSIPDVQAKLVERGRGTPAGISTLIRLLHRTCGRLGQGDPPGGGSWRTYERHIRHQLAEILADKEVRRLIAVQLSWRRQVPYKAAAKEMVALHREAAARVALEDAGARAGIVLVES